MKKVKASLTSMLTFHLNKGAKEVPFELRKQARWPFFQTALGV